MNLKQKDLLMLTRKIGGYAPAPRYQMAESECQALCGLHNLGFARVAPDWSFMLTKQGEAKADELIEKEGDHV